MLRRKYEIAMDIFGNARCGKRFGAGRFDSPGQAAVSALASARESAAAGCRRHEQQQSGLNEPVDPRPDESSSWIDQSYSAARHGNPRRTSHATGNAADHAGRSSASAGQSSGNTWTSGNNAGPARRATWFAGRCAAVRLIHRPRCAATAASTTPATSGAYAAQSAVDAVSF